MTHPVTVNYKLTFKWGCWAADLSDWEERDKNVGALLKQPNPYSFCFILDSVKATRSGLVTITHIPGAPKPYSARGHFTEEWDDLSDIQDTIAGILHKPHLERSDDLKAFLEYETPFADGENGSRYYFENVCALSVEDLLEAVDAQEDNCIEHSESEWNDLVTEARKRFAPETEAAAS